MIHPSDLLRSDSRSKQFIAPLNLQGESENDWGVHILPCLAKLFNWKTYAKPSVFTVILSLIGFIQGFLLFYFRNTSELWSKHYGISKGTSEWVIYVNEFFVGLVALPISYWASSTHEIRWISLVSISHGIFSVLMIIPEEMFARTTFPVSWNVSLCGKDIQRIEEDSSSAAFIYIIVYQLLTSAASVTFYSLGLVYMDNNTIRNRPTILAVALGSRLLGQQFGIYASWLPNWFNTSRVFRSFAWQATCFLYILLSVGIAMFPKVLPSLLIKKLAASLLEIASGVSTSDVVNIQDGIFTILKRILKKKIIVLSVISAVAMQSALINFEIFEDYFKQSRFFISDNFDNFGYRSSFSLNFVTSIMEKPLTILCLVVAGLVISRRRIKLKYLVLWNIAIYSIATILFSSNLFIKCEYEDMTQLVPSCSIDCNCILDETFNPVCLKGKTYYSPCHAGCNRLERIGQYQIYKNCTCESFEGTATDGSCHSDKCRFVYQMSQVNNVIIIRGLLATSIITNIVIVLSMVRGMDKAVALGLEMAFQSLVPFLPVKLGYQIVAEKLCRHWYQGKCRIYSPQLSTFLSNITIALMLLGTVTQMLLLSTKLDELEKPVRRRKNRKNSDISSKKAASIQHFDSDTSDPGHIQNDFLRDFDSLGDDHDSDDDQEMTGDSREAEDRINSSLLESHL